MKNTVRYICLLLFCICTVAHTGYAQHYVGDKALKGPVTFNGAENKVLKSDKSFTLKPGFEVKPATGQSLTLEIAFPATVPDDNEDMNWIQTTAYKENETPVSQSKAFFDYRGQALQNQTRNFTKDEVLASQPLYDTYGRPAATTLPAPINSNSFVYKENFVKNSSGSAYDYKDFDEGAKLLSPDPVDNKEPGTLGWYYSDNNTLEPYVATTGYPYSRTEFYQDGSGEAKRSAGPGDHHRLGSGHEATSGTFPVVDELDHYMEVRKIVFPGLTMPGNLSFEAVQQIGVDANGRESISIADKSGNVLMSALPGNGHSVTNVVSIEDIHYFYLLETTGLGWSGTGAATVTDLLTDTELASLPASLGKGFYRVDVTGPKTLTYTINYGNISYNFYDDAGRLVASVAPRGVEDILSNGLPATKAGLTYTNTYEYNHQGWLLAMTEPDAGRTEYMYRKDGSIRFSQNAEQRQGPPARFSYTDYDQLGRPVESGEYLGTLQFNSNALKALLENKGNNSWADADKQDWVKTFYDLKDTGASWPQDFVMGNVSYTENEHVKTWYSYDGQGRVAWMVQEVKALSQQYKVEYAYGFLGNVTQVKYQEGEDDAFYHKYSYDADQRLKRVETSNDGSTWQEQAEYHYYLHGPLKRVELADNLQGIDYVYTIQGWLKSINNPEDGADPGSDGSNGFAPDAFAMGLEYFSGDYTRSGSGVQSLAVAGHDPYYNGNILAMSWKTRKPEVVTGLDAATMYAFRYDDKYQLTEASWGTPDFANNQFTAQGNTYKVANLAYDANGNIKTLERYNNIGSIDKDFSYNYISNTNQLQSVSSYAGYTYNAIGQMISEVPEAGPQKHLNYDVTGKVKEIKNELGVTKLSFTYDDRGFRLSKKDHGTGKVTYYIRDASGSLLSLYDNETGGTIDQKEVPLYGSGKLGIHYTMDNTTSYELSDHLGNVRAVISRGKKNGLADVLTYTDYYPFGSVLRSGGVGYRYGYQGEFSEKDEETGWNSFELRMYDAVIGRWTGVDPYRQFASPYLGMGNNPIGLIDPDGGSTWDIIFQNNSGNELGRIITGDDNHTYVTVDTDMTVDSPVILDPVKLGAEFGKSFDALGFGLQGSFSFGGGMNGGNEWVYFLKSKELSSYRRIGGNIGLELAGGVYGFAAWNDNGNITPESWVGISNSYSGGFGAVAAGYFWTNSLNKSELWPGHLSGQKNYDIQWQGVHVMTGATGGYKIGGLWNSSKTWINK